MNRAERRRAQRLLDRIDEGMDFAEIDKLYTDEEKQLIVRLMCEDEPEQMKAAVIEGVQGLGFKDFRAFHEHCLQQRAKRAH